MPWPRIANPTSLSVDPIVAATTAGAAGLQGRAAVAAGRGPTTAALDTPVANDRTGPLFQKAEDAIEATLRYGVHRGIAGSLSGTGSGTRGGRGTALSPTGGAARSGPAVSAPTPNGLGPRSASTNPSCRTICDRTSWIVRREPS